MRTKRKNLRPQRLKIKNIFVYAAIVKGIWLLLKDIWVWLKA